MPPPRRAAAAGGAGGGGGPAPPAPARPLQVLLSVCPSVVKCCCCRAHAVSSPIPVSSTRAVFPAVRWSAAHRPGPCMGDDTKWQRAWGLCCRPGDEFDWCCVSMGLAMRARCIRCRWAGVTRFHSFCTALFLSFDPTFFALWYLQPTPMHARSYITSNAGARRVRDALPRGATPKLNTGAVM